MLKNYLKTALRNLVRNKSFTIINTLGLAIGIACCILIILFVRDEISYDKFHEKHDRIFRVVEKRSNPDGSVSVVPLSSGLVGEAAEASVH